MKRVRKINLVYLFAFFGDALFSPFIALYFISIGFDDFQRGIILALIPLCTILGNFVYGKISGRLNRNIKLVRLLGLINSLVIGVFGFVTNFYLLIGLTVIFSLHNSPYFSLQDGVGVTFCEKEKKIYSFTRMFGSMGYCLALILGSFIVDYFDYKFIFLIGAVFFLLINIPLLFIKGEEEEEENEKEKLSFSLLFSNFSFLKYFAFYLLVMGIWVVGESYISTYFKSLEIKDSYYSLMSALQVGVELIVIFLLSKFISSEKQYKTILFVSCLIVCLRYILLGTNINGKVLIIITSILRGVGWGGFLSSHIPTLKKIIGIELTPKAIAFLALCTNLIGSIGNFVTPYIYTKLSFQLVYLIFGLIQLIGIFLLTRVKVSRGD